MYDYKCLDCGKESLVVLSLKGYEQPRVRCPVCGSAKVDVETIALLSRFLSRLGLPNLTLEVNTSGDAADCPQTTRVNLHAPHHEGDLMKA
jgi:putative FmdB family regulatory protein